MTTDSNHQKRILFGLLYIALVVVFFEGSARLITCSPKIFKLLEGNDDISGRIRWELRHDGHVQYLNDNTYYIYDSLLGWRVKPDVSNFTTPKNKTVNSNSKGIRGKSEFNYERQPGKKRILLLGDSQTFGEEVSDDETYAHFLRETLPDVEVINMGVDGYGHDQMLLYLENEGLKYQPDIVILGYLTMDAWRNLFSFTNYAKPRFTLEEGKLHLINHPVPTPEYLWSDYYKRSRFLDLIRILYFKLVKEDEHWKREWDLTFAILDSIHLTIVQAGAIPVYAYLTTVHEVKDYDRDSTIIPEENSFLNYCNKRNIPYLSLTPKYIEYLKKGTKFQNEGHWNAQGNFIIAEGIKEYLVNSGILNDTTIDRYQ